MIRCGCYVTSDAPGVQTDPAAVLCDWHAKKHEETHGHPELVTLLPRDNPCECVRCHADRRFCCLAVAAKRLGWEQMA